MPEHYDVEIPENLCERQPTCIGKFGPQVSEFTVTITGVPHHFCADCTDNFIGGLAFMLKSREEIHDDATQVSPGTD